MGNTQQKTRELDAPRSPNPESEKFMKWLDPLHRSAKQKLEPLKISFANTALTPTDCAKEFKAKLTDKDLITSGSHWELKQLCNYIPPLRISYTDDDLPRSLVSEEMLKMQCSIISSHQRLADAFKDNNEETILKQLSKKAYTEQTI